MLNPISDVLSDPSLYKINPDASELTVAFKEMFSVISKSALIPLRNSLMSGSAFFIV